MADQRKKLNEEAYRIVKIKESNITKDGTVFPSKLSLVFMGDSHIGMKTCQEKGLPIPEGKYVQLLNKILENNNLNNGDILSIIHGGDATDKGEKNLETFINRAWETLYDPVSEDKNKIPLFLNIGNHDYDLSEGGSKGDLYTYNKLVAADILKQSNPPNQHPDIQVISLNHLNLRIILVNTGFTNRGYFGKAGSDVFKNQMKHLDTWMTGLENKNKKIRFIIDMHIPPNIGTLGINGGNPSHVLNDEYSGQFTKYMLDHHSGNILSVVAHHRHCKSPTRYYADGYGINFFLTPSGGHCDSVCGGHCDNCKIKNPYHAMKLNYHYSNHTLTADKETYNVISL